VAWGKDPQKRPGRPMRKGCARKNFWKSSRHKKTPGHIFTKKARFLLTFRSTRKNLSGWNA